MAGSCQFVGKEQVIAAFESREVEAWAIFQYKQFIHKGYGSQDLSAFLDMLKEGGTNATYTLKIYEDQKDTKGIKEKTECDGSYNFKINGPAEGVAGTGYYNKGNEEILKRLAAIEERQLVLLDDDDEPESIGAVVSSAVVEVIRDPNKALQWMEVLKNLFGNKTSQPGPAVVRQIQPPAAVGNIPITEDEKLERLEKAIDTLAANDEKLILHLEKLAEISAKNPGKFKMLLSMLENF